MLTNTSGFIYFVSITGITGTKSVDSEAVASAVSRLRESTELPIAVGFGIKTPEQAAAIARVADAVVVGSALVNKIAEGADAPGEAKARMVTSVLDCARELAEGVRNARLDAPADTGGDRRLSSAKGS